MADTCRLCLAPVRWVRTWDRDRLMALDAQPDPAGTVMLADNGKAVMLTGEPQLFEVERWMPHEATCTGAVYNARRSRERARAGAARAADHAGPAWRQEARELIGRLAVDEVEFTPEDMWIAGLSRPSNDARALGAIFLWAAKQGLIEKTGRTRPTSRVHCHAGTMTIWRSLIYQGPYK